MSDQKLLRLEKRHKGLARVTAAINDLIYTEFMRVIIQR